MREAGIFGEDDRVELIDGEIYVMSPIGPLHIALVNRLTKILVTHAADDAIVSIQNSIQLDDYSEPQPDVVVLSPRADYYAQALPRPDDVYFIIEVADTSLGYDRDQKLPRYAEANISEVWIIDVNQRIVEQYSHPSQGQYTHLYKILLGDTIQSLTLPKIAIPTNALFRMQ
jgi:Uma2 family endonuclease